MRWSPAPEHVQQMTLACCDHHPALHTNQNAKRRTGQGVEKARVWRGGPGPNLEDLLLAGTHERLVASLVRGGQLAELVLELDELLEFRQCVVLLRLLRQTQEGHCRRHAFARLGHHADHPMHLQGKHVGWGWLG